MSVIFLLSTLQLPEYVVDLTIKSDEKDSDEKLNLEVRVSLSPVLIQLFSNEAKLTIFFFTLYSSPNVWSIWLSTGKNTQNSCV